MRYMIGVDCEGPACVVGAPGSSLTNAPDYAFATLQATREADAAARALFDAGAEQVIVWDNHGGRTNLHYDLLDERCDIALGANQPHRWPGLTRDFAGVLFIGYHAMDNTIDGPMCHTFSSAMFQWQKVNGQEVGELAIDAAVAGELGVPPLFLASDDKAVAEARRFFGDLPHVTTKIGYGWNAAVSMHPKRAVKQIYEVVLEAVERRSERKPLSFGSPVTLEQRFKRLEAADGRTRGGDGGGWERVDAYTVRRTADRITDFY